MRENKGRGPVRKIAKVCCVGVQQPAAVETACSESRGTGPVLIRATLVSAGPAPSRPSVIVLLRHTHPRTPNTHSHTSGRKYSEKLRLAVTNHGWEKILHPIPAIYLPNLYEYLLFSESNVLCFYVVTLSLYVSRFSDGSFVRSDAIYRDGLVSLPSSLMFVSGSSAFNLL